MKFFGVHEVRVKGAGIRAGYFESYTDALAAVALESEYKAAWVSLNPLDVAESTERGRIGAVDRTAKDEHVLRRVRILLDFDPKREPDTNATDEEKRTALEQAEACRAFLRSKGWPEPMFADSGNGYHLLYRIDMPNDAASTDLVRRFLAAMAARFDLLDAGNFNAARVCKLYGTWARKGPSTGKRPHRLSAILEPGEDRTVSAEAIRDLTPEGVSKGLVVKHEDVKLKRLLDFLGHYGIGTKGPAREISGGWQVPVVCPWSNEHSSEGVTDTVVSFRAGQGFGFKCLHSHCAGRNWQALVKEVKLRNSGLADFFGQLPRLTHADVARAFVAQTEDFVRLYDAANETGHWLEGAHWEVGDAKDARLKGAIRAYLNELYQRLPAPEDGKKDARLQLENAFFCAGVLNEARLLLPVMSQRHLDRNPAILALPNSETADLLTGKIRATCREDYQSRRLDISPVDARAPRWERFLLEVMDGDEELAAYLERLAAIAITGYSPHALVFFHGEGRNGKGAYFRVLRHILRENTFSAVIQPKQLQYPTTEDSNKRLFAALRGKRLCYNAESVKGGLDETLLKALTGGDALAGARLYEDAEGFEPTHLLCISTNNPPKLPATAAFKGRLRFVPFEVSFLGREDSRLDADLKAEAPAILHRLIKLAPSIWDGDKPPAKVLEASRDLLDANDHGGLFIAEMLTEDEDSVVRVQDMHEAIARWCELRPDANVGEVMTRVKARWPVKQKRVAGRTNPVHGVVGVRVASSSRV